MRRAFREDSASPLGLADGGTGHDRHSQRAAPLPPSDGRGRAAGRPSLRSRRRSGPSGRTGDAPPSARPSKCPGRAAPSKVCPTGPGSGAGRSTPAGRPPRPTAPRRGRPLALRRGRDPPLRRAGYVSRSSPGPNCSGFTKMDTTSGRAPTVRGGSASDARRAARPSWAPGRPRPRPPASRRSPARRSAAVRITSIGRLTDGRPSDREPPRRPPGRPRTAARRPRPDRAPPGTSRRRRRSCPERVRRAPRGSS